MSPNFKINISDYQLKVLDGNKSLDEVKKSVTANGKDDIAFETKEGKKYLISADQINIKGVPKDELKKNIFAGAKDIKILFTDVESVKNRPASPVQLGNNVIDPANIDSRYYLPAPDHIAYRRNTGSTRGMPIGGTLEELSGSLGSGSELIENVSALIDDIDYEANSLKDNAFRRPVGEVWQGFETKGECSDIHNIGTYLLNENGIEAYTVQIGRTTGPHNVTIFKNEDGNYDIMEYGRIYDVDADSPEDAMREFQNARIGTVYKYVIYKPTKDGFEVRSIGQGRAAALFDAFTTTPNLDFNTFVGGKLHENGIYAGSDGLQVNAPGGWKLTSKIEHGQLENIGIGNFQTNEKGITQGGSVIYDKPTGMIVGQYQHIADKYKWMSAGVMYHSPLSSNSELSTGERGQINMPTLVPFIGGSYGGEKDLVKNDTLRWAINGFIQGRLALPLVLTEEGRHITGHAQNGNVPWMDGGQLMGFAQLKTGVGSELEFTPWKVGDGELKMKLGYQAKYEIVDPTLIYRDPTAFLSNTGTVGLNYQTPVGKDLKLELDVKGQLTDSKFVYEQNRVDGEIKLENQDKKWGVGLKGSVAESGFGVGANGYYMFNEKVGLMGGVGYDSTATRINPDGAGFNVGVGTIFRF